MTPTKAQLQEVAEAMGHVDGNDAWWQYEDRVKAAYPIIERHVRKRVPQSSPGPIDEARMIIGDFCGLVGQMCEYIADKIPGDDESTRGKLLEKLIETTGGRATSFLSRIASAPVTFQEGHELEVEMAAVLAADLLPGLKRARDMMQDKKFEPHYFDGDEPDGIDDWYRCRSRAFGDGQKIIEAEIAAQGEATNGHARRLSKGE